MFGKPEWFKQSTCCNGVSPVSFKGWMYVAGWAAFIVMPLAGLGLMGKVVPEALVWLAFSGLAFLWDMRDIRRQMQAQHDRTLLYIDDEREASPELATRRFDMKLRD
ncbi:MAG: hypothetical protein KY475_03365 [Planctomycetes bacterium]|nr:hypothetical protein [Planctomycetota bacterium]